GAKRCARLRIPMTRSARAAAFVVSLAPVALLAGAHVRPAASAAPAAAATAAAPPAPAAAAPSVPRLVRIGLTTDPLRARITADGGVVVRDPQRHTPIWRKAFDPGLTFVAEVQGKGPVVIYRVQVGSYGTKEGGEEQRAAIEALLGNEKVVTVWNPDRH